ncbi:MAG: alpha-xylosidase [Turicibacter sp.]|nr:alpha-xylosidase [Turicibacter sp.]
MKFSNGCWLDREGFKLNYPSEVYAYDQEEKKLTLYGPFVKVKHRGNTLDGGMLSVELTAPLENVIRVRAYHHLGLGLNGPHHDLNISDMPIQINEEEKHFGFSTGGLGVKIQRSESFTLEFFQDGKPLTASEHRGLSYIEGDNQKAYMRDQLSLDVGELIYGLGERFSPFIKNGQSIEIWNEDGGTGSEQAYKNIPFYLSNKGYGVFVNHPEKVSVEVASEKNSKVQFSVEGEILDYFIINGPTPKDVLERYTTLTGKPSLPPAWSFGLWLSTSFTTNYDEKTVMSFIDGMKEKDIPFDVFHFDCFWMKEFEWCNFAWDERVFPDPVGMIKRIKEKGLKVCLWINAYIGQKSPLFKEGMDNGYFIKRPDGSTWQWDKWQAGLAIVDFTNPAACRWYESKLEALMDMGVDSFKTDFGERIPTDVIYFDGSNPEKMHNYYAYLYNEVVFEMLERRLGKNEAVLFARSAATGSQKFPVHWGGDCWSTYPSMAESLRGGLSFSLSGFSYWSHDISGFEHGTTPDLYKRWTQFGLLSSHSRYHGNTEYKVPWFYGDEAVEVSKTFSKLKNRLMPYLWKNAVESSKTGVPMMRPMLLDFSDDETTHYLDRQYMFGDKLLVAPIFNAEGTVKYYAPEGIWTNLLTNEKVEGGKWHSETHGYLTLPLLVKENTILPLGNVDGKADYDYLSDLEVHLFEISKSSITLQTSDLKKSGSIYAKREGETLIIRTEGLEGTNRFILRNVLGIKSIEGGIVVDSEQGIEITATADKIKINL